MSKRMKTFVTTCVLSGLLFGLAPSSAWADWDNRSGSLPGIMSGKKLVILSGAAGAGVVALFLLKKKSRSQKPPDVVDPAEAPTSSLTVPTGDFVRELRADPRYAPLWQLGAANGSVK